MYKWKDNSLLTCYFQGTVFTAYCKLVILAYHSIQPIGVFHGGSGKTKFQGKKICIFRATNHLDC